MNKVADTQIESDQTSCKEPIDNSFFFQFLFMLSYPYGGYRVFSL